MEHIRAFWENYRYLWEGDFNRGYICGVALVLLIVLLMLAIRLIVSIAFRTRRCKELTVSVPDGDVVVSLSALADCVMATLRSFPALQVRDVRLYRSGGTYWLELFSAFDASGAMNFPNEISAVKQQIFEALKNTFGIDNVRKIRIRVEELSGVPSHALPEQSDIEPAIAEPPKAESVAPDADTTRD